jgi:hypothetical protein
MSAGETTEHHPRQGAFMLSALGLVFGAPANLRAESTKSRRFTRRPISHFLRGHANVAIKYVLIVMRADIGVKVEQWRCSPSRCQLRAPFADGS